MRRKIPAAAADRPDLRAREEGGQPVGLLDVDLGMRRVRVGVVLVGHARPEAGVLVQVAPERLGVGVARKESARVDLGRREIGREGEELAPRARAARLARGLGGEPVAGARGLDLAGLGRDLEAVVVHAAVVGRVDRDERRRVMCRRKLQPRRARGRVAPDGARAAAGPVAGGETDESGRRGLLRVERQTEVGRALRRASRRRPDRGGRRRAFPGGARPARECRRGSARRNRRASRRKTSTGRASSSPRFPSPPASRRSRG